MKIAPRDISVLLSKPDPKYQAYLLYGHDDGLLRERARTIALHFVHQLDDPFAVSHLSGQNVVADKACIADSINTLPVFGGLRLVMLSGTGTELTEAVKIAFDSLHDKARLVIKASDVNTRHALVKFCDQHPSCASIGCYQDDSRSLGDLAQEIFNRNHIQISREALSLLVSRLGSDRAVSRQEIEKLALFAGSGGKLTEEDINNALGDSGAVVQDLITIAILNGNLQQFEQLYSRSQQDGLLPISLLRQVLSLFRNMLKARLILETGKTSSAALSSLRPALHFKIKPVVTAQLAKWTSDQLTEVIYRLISTEIQMKTTGAVNPSTLTGQTLLGIVLRSRSLNRK